MTYRDPYVLPDGPIARLAAKMVGYDGSLPSSTFTPREQWKVGRTSNSTPSTHCLIHEGVNVELNTDTNFNNFSKRDGFPLNINLVVNKTIFAEDAGYPHMQPGGKRDQRRLTIYHCESLPMTLLESLVGRPVRNFVELPKWLDEVIGWRTIIAITGQDPPILVIDHQQWEQDTEQ